MLLLKESLQHKTHKNLWKESLIIYMSKYAHLSPQKGCMYACSVAKSYLILCNPMDCNPPVSSVHGIFQARILEWVAIFSSRASSQPRDGTHISCVSCISRQILCYCATFEAARHNFGYNFKNLQFPGFGRENRRGEQVEDRATSGQ